MTQPIRSAARIMGVALLLLGGLLVAVAVPAAPALATAAAPHAGIIGFDAAEYRVDETAGSVVLTAVLSPPPTQTVVVDVGTSSLEASESEDYIAIRQRLSIPAGTAWITVAVEIIDDQVVEPDESFLVVLSNPRPFELGDIRAAVVTIVDDDIAELAIADVDVTSADPVAVFTLTQSLPAVLTTTVEYITEDGSALAGVDYIATQGVIAFAPGSTMTTVEVELLPVARADGVREFSVRLTNPTNAFLARALARASVTAPSGAPAPLYLPALLR